VGEPVRVESHRIASGLRLARVPPLYAPARQNAGRRKCRATPGRDDNAFLEGRQDGRTVVLCGGRVEELVEALEDQDQGEDDHGNRGDPGHEVEEEAVDVFAH
jgi:hypothetical protein